tara:strand:- start:1383 stop:2069 length:687 start_codon:yes stop_codon:yes gene_type:complete
MMNFQFIPKSANAKIGPMPASNSARATCPPSCPLIGKGGCYADAGFHTRLNWDKLDAGERGTPWPQFVDKIAALKPDTVWRHNVSGDLPPSAPDEIDSDKLKDLIAANDGRRGFTYTHYPMNAQNARKVRSANRRGFTINASANNEAQAVGYAKRNLPTVAIISDEKRGNDWRAFDRGGVKFVRCPAEYREGVNCLSCKLCTHAKRKTVVGFTVHGSRAASANIIARG